jgi:hypothetical protein
MELLVLIDGSATLGGHPTAAGDVWYLEAGVREIELSGTAKLLQVLP